MKMQSKFPTSDLFATLRIYGQTILLPIGRLYDFQVHRIGTTIDIVSRHKGEQIAHYVINLPNGI